MEDFHTFNSIFNTKDVCNSPNKHSLEHELFYGRFIRLIYFLKLRMVGTHQNNHFIDYMYFKAHFMRE